MAEADSRSTEDVRRDIATERDELAGAVEDLRAGIGEATNLRGKLPLIAASCARRRLRPRGRRGGDDALRGASWARRAGTREARPLLRRRQVLTGPRVGV